MSDSIPDAATPEHLTDVLRRAGVLSAGKITSVSVDSSRQMILSTVMRLRLEVEGTPGATPLSLFFKRRRPDSPIDAEAIGRAEVDFYSRVAPLTPGGLLPLCFEAAMEGGWHPLIEDLSDSHDIVSQWPLPPTVEQVDRILGAHARFHAFWWDHPALGSVGAFLDTGGFDRGRVSRPARRLRGPTRRPHVVRAPAELRADDHPRATALRRAVPAASEPHAPPRRRARVERALPARPGQRRRQAHRLGRLADRRGHRRSCLHDRGP